VNEQARHVSVPFPAGSADRLIALAARAPSVLNTQPWTFRVTRYRIELFADRSRRLRCDAAGREMLISCGAAVFGLRLAIRSIGYRPVVRLLPDLDQPGLLADVRLGAPAAVTDAERAMIGAMPRRHTHRGSFAAEPLPAGLLIGLQHDAMAERAALALIDRPAQLATLAVIAARAARSQAADERARADVRQWARTPGSVARDGVPAGAMAPPGGAPGRLAQRDLELARCLAPAAAAGPPPAMTAVLLTPGDTRADWLRAGQALHRMLVHAAASWVFADIYSQPLEVAPVRGLIRSRLALPGAPQLILQLGVARSARSTARRPAAQLIRPQLDRRGPARGGPARRAPAKSGLDKSGTCEPEFAPAPAGVG